MDEEPPVHSPESSGLSLQGRIGHAVLDPNDLPFLTRHKGLLRLKQWVAQNGALRLTLEHAAELACLSPHHFSTAFRKHGGVTFKEWRRQIRIWWAVGAIEAGQYSINEVVYLAGYRDRRAFERAVKRVAGATPGCIRRNSEVSDGACPHDARSEPELKPQRP